MIHFLFGSETYFLRRRAAELQEQYRREVDPRGFSMHRFSGDTFKFEDFSNAVRTVNLLSPSFFVSVEGVLTQKGFAKLADELLSVLKAVKADPHSKIVFVEPLYGSKKSPWASVKLVNALKRIATVEEFKPLTLAQQKTWMSQRAKERGITIEPDAAELLNGMVGTDLIRLDHECAKLAAYVQARPITKQDVVTLVAPDFTDDLFAFTDALGRRRVDEALKRLHRLIASDHHPLMLLTMIVRHFRILTYVKTAAEQGGTSNLASEMKLHPFVITKSVQQAKMFSLEELKALLRDLETMDRQTKTRGIDLKLLLDLFVVKINTPQ